MRVVLKAVLRHETSALRKETFNKQIIKKIQATKYKITTK